MKSSQGEHPKNDNQQADGIQKYSVKMKGSLTLSNTEMLQLIEDEQKFVQQVIYYNKIGIDSLLIQDFQTALIYLQQAEKVLQYAANCGKTIDRFLIIATLHNEATVYQKLLQLQKSFDYMQAILHNLDEYFYQNPNINITEQIINKQSNYYKVISLFLHRKIKTVIYNLQFAAMSSQIDRHELAISSAKKSLTLLGWIIQKFIIYSRLVKTQQVKQSQFRSLNKYCMGIDKSQIANLTKNVRESVLALRLSTTEDKNQLKLKKFSIGEVMQMQATSFKESNQYLPIQNLVMSYPFTKMGLYTSICYYTIATQMRLIAKKDRIQAQLSSKFLKSKIFHLISIKIALQFAPFFSQYHQHIIRSFKNNYQVDLNIDLPEGIEDQKLKQSLLSNESFVVRRQIALSQQIAKNIKSQSEYKNVRPRRISSESSSHANKQKTQVLNLNLKTKKKKKNKSRQQYGITQSRQIIFHHQKQKVDIRKSIPLKVQKKLMSIPATTSRTKIGKPKFFPQKQKKKKGGSSQRTKDNDKKTQNSGNKQRLKKRIMQEYNPGPESTGKQLKFNKKNSRKIINSKSKSKSKNKSGKRQLISPRVMGLSNQHTQKSINCHDTNNYNIGMRSPRHK